jgi:hypothetical protein
MTTTATPNTTASDIPVCPWWCTARPAEHEWSLDHFGGRTGLHHRTVGGFTVYATERNRPGAPAAIELYATQTGFVAVRTAAEAAQLTEDLRQLTAILRRIESDADLR